MPRSAVGTAVAALALAFALTARAAAAQGVFGTYTLATPNGGTVTLLLQRGSSGTITGSLSGNGSTFTVTGAELQGEDVRGSLKSSDGSVVFHAHRTGDQLQLTVADLGANGQPDLGKTRQIVLARQGAEVAATEPKKRGGMFGALGRALEKGIAANNAANAMTSGAASGGSAMGMAAGGSPVTGATTSDTQLIQLLTSSAWCTFSYSGGKTYTGGSYGRTSSTRTVFGSNGIVSQTSGSENTNTGAPGNVYASQSGGTSGRWKAENGQLMLSQDGMSWVAQPMKVELNSAGNPIITSGGKEYMRCR